MMSYRQIRRTMSPYRQVGMTQDTNVRFKSKYIMTRPCHTVVDTRSFVSTHRKARSGTSAPLVDWINNHNGHLSQLALCGNIGTHTPHGPCIVKKIKTCTLLCALHVVQGTCRKVVGKRRNRHNRRSRQGGIIIHGKYLLLCCDAPSSPALLAGP